MAEVLGNESQCSRRRELGAVELDDVSRLDVALLTHSHSRSLPPSASRSDLLAQHYSSSTHHILGEERQWRLQVEGLEPRLVPGLVSKEQDHSSVLDLPLAAVLDSEREALGAGALFEEILMRDAMQTGQQTGREKMRLAFHATSGGQ